MDKISVTASEIGEYVYCKRAWWLRSNYSGKGSINKLEGNIHHNTLLDQVTKNKLLIFVASVMSLLGIILIVISFILEFLW